MTTAQRGTIRNVARGILVENRRVLLVEVDDGHDRWWILPGGGQEFGETLEECLARECREELDITVRVGPCIMVREFISDRRSAVVGVIRHHHSLELYFLLTTQENPDLVPREVTHRRVQWVELEELERLAFFPRALSRVLPALLDGSELATAYVGDAD